MLLGQLKRLNVETVEKSYRIKKKKKRKKERERKKEKKKEEPLSATIVAGDV